MPRVPQAQNLIERAPANGTRLQAFDAGGEVIGKGVQQLGAAMSDFAQAQARATELRAETEAREFDTIHMRQTGQLRNRVLTAQGLNAPAALAEAEKELQKYNKELVSKGSSPLTRKLIQRVVDHRSALELESWSLHSAKEERRGMVGAFESRITGFAETAIDTSDDPVLFEENIAAGLNEIGKLGEFAGEGEAVQVRRRQFLSNVYIGQAQRRAAADDPQGALAILDARRDVIDSASDIALRRTLKGELDDLQKDSDVAGLPMFSGKREDRDLPPGETTFQPPIRTATVTVPGGRYGAPRPYGAHVGVDQAGVKPGTPVYPMAGGTIAKVGKTAGGGNTVEVALAGGWRMTVKHLADGSTKHLKAGQEVGVNDVIGGVGNTGSASSGTHLHTELVDPSGRRVDPSKFYGQPAPRTPAPDGRRIDLARGYAEIEAMPWTPARKARARDRLREYAGENDTVMARVEQDADRAVSEQLLAIERAGGKLTRLTQLDADTVARAKPETQRQLLSMIEQNNRPKEVKPYGDVALGLELMAISRPDEFVGSNLMLFRHEMTPAEFSQLARAQAQMRAKGPTAPIAVDHGRMWSTINRYAPDVGLDPSSADKDKREKAFRVFDTMRTTLGRITDGKRVPTDDEIKSAFDAATMEVIVRGGGWFGRDTRERRFDVEPGSRIGVEMPQSARARIVQSLTRALGRAPTEQQIGETYLRAKGAGVL